MEFDEKTVWDSSLSVDEKTIDKQHKDLIERINKNIDIISSLETNMGQLRELGHFMFTFIKEHFAYEEKYMEEKNYPDLEKHKKIHQEFSIKYKELEKDFKEKATSGKFSSVEMGEFLLKVNKYLLQWFVDHTKCEDQKYAKYIRSH